MRKYQHLFFDLDRTLWDFEANSVLALQEIFTNRKLATIADWSFREFHEFYKKYNHLLWDQYKLGKVEKSHLRIERFRGTLKKYGIQDEELAKTIADDYVLISPQKTKLFPNVIEVLNALKDKYRMHIITNGFSEVQFVKLEKSGLSSFFEEVITSEMVGVQKPDVKVFEYALKITQASVNESIMIGDDQDSDINGAQKMGMDQVFVDYHFEKLVCQPTYHIHQLSELLDLL